MSSGHRRAATPPPVLSRPDVGPAAAGLRFVQDTEPGLTRRRAGRGFAYHDAEGRRVTEPDTLARIRSLAVPPAWSSVWICPDPDGHLQAVGWDARGRKQYRYHPGWRELRDRAKFDRLAGFGAALPGLRATVEEQLGRRDLSRDRVLAGVVALLDRTLLRVGNERYAAENATFGLTTMRNRHARVGPGRVAFSFRGKSGVRHAAVVADRRLVTLVRRCQELPGQNLFEWTDADGTVHPVCSTDVNACLASWTGGPYTAKDFRTWGASARVAATLASAPPAPTKREATQVRNAAVDEAARLLGNTRAVCRASYVHPAVFETYADGALAELAGAAVRRGSRRLSGEERILVGVLAAGVSSQ